MRPFRKRPRITLRISASNSTKIPYHLERLQGMIEEFEQIREGLPRRLALLRSIKRRRAFVESMGLALPEKVKDLGPAVKEALDLFEN